MINIFPKLLYLFQNLTLSPPSNLFSHLKSLYGEMTLSRQEEEKGDLKSGLNSPDGKHPMSFDEIFTKYDIPRNQFFKYLQLRHFIRPQQNQSLATPVLSIIEEMMVKDGQGRGLISNISHKLVDESSETSVNRLKAWREDITTEEREKAGRKVQSQTVNTHLKLLQHNWLMRTYMTRDKLNKYNSERYQKFA